MRALHVTLPVTLCVTVTLLGATRSAPPADRRSSTARAVERVRPDTESSARIPLSGYTRHEGGAEPPPASGLGGGPVLDLEGGRRVTPLVAPGHSFVVRFTPPRAGTFIYHTHADEVRQQLAGLAGALVVRAPGDARDPATDVPVLIPEALVSLGHPSIVLVNEQAAPARLHMRAGTTYRLRFIQIGASRSALSAELGRDGADSTWRPVAGDGAQLPASARGASPARLRMGIDETYAVEVSPESMGDLRLEVRTGLARPQPTVVLTTPPIRVHPAERREPR